ncbi:MAG: MBL fold metallo-hydrolase [Actinomycetota bacterium]
MAGQPKVKFTPLGTSTPYPRPDNACSGYLLQHETTNIWVDAGTGTLAELQRHIALGDLDAIWISHAHADHSADLLTAYYALRFGETELAHPVPLFCPPGLRERLAAFLGPQAVKGLPKAFDFHEHHSWSEHGFGGIELAWGPVDHGMPAYALRATAGGRAVAYSGDTAYCESLVEIAQGTDLLLCEVGYSSKPALGENVHCTPEDAGRTAREAGVARLALTHLALAPDEAKARASAVYEGEVLIAQPGLELMEPDSSV